jgi:hypothetical protein
MNVAELEHVTVTPQERQDYIAMQAEDVAQLSPPDRRKYERAMLENVFGHDVTFWNDPATGQRVPRERGIGSEGRTNTNHEFWTKKRESERDLNEAILAAVQKT